MKSTKLSALRRARARKRREGVVLLVVVTVLMLITSTAIFAVQQTMWEMRAGGSANQALTTRYTAEAYATLGIAGLSQRELYLEATRPIGVAGGWQDKFGLPEFGAQHDYVSVARNTDYSCPLGFWCSGAPLGPENAFPAADIGPYEGLAGPLTEISMSTIERWELTGENDPTPEVRYVVTAYGAMAPVGDVNEDLAVDATTTVADETGRTVEETISIARAYYTAPE
jgi:hypothetical protein